MRPGRPVKESMARLAATSQRPARAAAGISARVQPTASRRRPEEANETRRPRLADGPCRGRPRSGPRRRRSGLGFSWPCGSKRSRARASGVVRLGRLDFRVDLELRGPLGVVPRRRERGAQVLPERLPGIRRHREAEGGGVPAELLRVPRAPRAPRARRAASSRRSARCRPRRLRPSSEEEHGARHAAGRRGTPRCRGRRGASLPTAGPASTTTASRAGSKLVSSRARTVVDELLLHGAALVVCGFDLVGKDLGARRVRGREELERPRGVVDAAPWRSGGERSGRPPRASTGRGPPGRRNA